jgi:hypothetical protein
MGAGTIMVSRALAEAGHPEVTLICGADFYYFLFDNMAKRQSGEAHVQETAIVRHPRFDAVPVDRLVFEGVEFAKRVKAAVVRAD